eukprot:jgi/Tetstr1/463357/TSEL_008280.t1
MTSSIYINPAAVKPTLDPLKYVHIWDNTISTRDNAQAIKISLGSAGYLDTTKGKGLRPDYDHIVDITISVATVDERLATIINAGQNMEARKRQRQHRVRAYPPNLNYYNPRDPQHATRHVQAIPNSSIQGHQQANYNSNQRPIGHHEAFPFVGVSPSARHHNSLPINLTCATAAPGGAATGAQEGEGEDIAEDDLHGPSHVPYSDSDDDF